MKKNLTSNLYIIHPKVNYFNNKTHIINLYKFTKSFLGKENGAKSIDKIQKKI
jgi:hypothetical protein